MPASRAQALQRGRAALELLAAAPLPAAWRREGWCLYRCPEGVRASARIAAFDFDKTLHFGGAAWWLSSAHIPGVLRRLHDDEGYKVVVFSNQHGPSRQRTQEGMHKAVQETLARFDSFATFCGLPLQMFVAAARADVDDPFRKPNIGMWELLASSPLCNGGVAPEPRASFYVGNAAGRKADGNDVDREFARRVGLEFRTEEWLVQPRAGGRGG